MSAEAAYRDLEARMSRANDDKRAAETRLADLTKERDRLAARVKTLGRDLGTARKAAGAPAKPPAQTGEGAEGAEGPTVERGGGGGAILPVSRTFWPARRPGMPRLRQRPARCPLSRPVSGWPCWQKARQSRWQPWRPTWPRSLPPTSTWAGSTPPTASRQRRWTPLSSRRWSKAPRALLARALLQGGGGGRSSPFNFGTTCPF